MSQRSLLGALLFAAAAFVAPVAQAQTASTGSVSGRVTDAATGQPIGAAQINVVGTTLGAQTNQDGIYSIRAVPAGAVTLRVLRLGLVPA